MSFDPALIADLRSMAPRLTHGIAVRNPAWAEIAATPRRALAGLLQALRARPQFLAYSIANLPAPLPTLARTLFGLPLLAWTLRVVNSISEVAAEAWDGCANPALPERGNGPVLAPCAPAAKAERSVLGDRYNPFISHDFLSALELSQSVRARTGWQPLHLLAEDAQRGLFGAVPCYVKSHSRGEYVFDHGWAEAYERAGGSYYPKLQVAVPFTPATGRRL